jgi:tetratricopeptide (TPR) repeat protein
LWNLASGALDQANAIWVVRGWYGRALPIWHRRAEVMAHVTDPNEIGDFHAMGAWHHYELGDYPRALEIADRGLVAVEGHSLGGSLHILSWRVASLFRLGRWDEALETFERMRTVLDDRRDMPPYYATNAYGAAGSIHEARGDRTASDRIASIVLELTTTRAYSRLYGWAVRFFVDRGELDRAAEVPRAGPDWRVHANAAYEAWAELLAVRGTWDEAPDLLAQMREQAAVAPSPALAASADRLEGRSALAAGDPARAIALLAAASAGFDTLGCRWERAVTDLEIAEASHDAGLATAAAEVFAELRTPAWLERARAVARAVGSNGH